MHFPSVDCHKFYLQLRNNFQLSETTIVVLDGWRAGSVNRSISHYLAYFHVNFKPQDIYYRMKKWRSFSQHEAKKLLEAIYDGDLKAVIALWVPLAANPGSGLMTTDLDWQIGPQYVSHQ